VAYFLGPTHGEELDHGEDWGATPVHSWDPSP